MQAEQVCVKPVFMVLLSSKMVTRGAKFALLHYCTWIHRSVDVEIYFILSLLLAFILFGVSH